jgi:hypothetical protein
MQFIFSKSIIHRLWLIVLLALCIAGMAFALDVAAQEDQTPHVTPIVEALNVRSGPGVTYPAIGVLLHGDRVPIIGRHVPTGWWQVELADGRTGWVSGGVAYVQVSGDTGGVPGVLASAAPAAGATPAQAGAIVFQTVSGGSIYAIGADGTNLRYLTMGMDPALSPDGRQVAFTRWEGPGHGAPGSLWVINIDGTGERVLHSDVKQPKAPVWSPDGTQIAISMQQGGRLVSEYKCSRSLPTAPIEGDYEDIRVVVDVDAHGDTEVKYCYTLLPHPYWSLRMVDVATGQFKDLPHDLFSYTPAWDPVNDWRLVYRGELGLVNLDLNQGTTWALTHDPDDYDPIFSPDGSRIAVAYKQHDHWDIHVMNADGSGSVRLTETPLRVIAEQGIKGQEPHSWNNVAPAWSPDGTQIAFLTDRNGQWEIWVMNADGSHQRPLFPPGTLNNLDLQYYSVGERVLSWR